jgi:hypothetical protein
VGACSGLTAQEPLELPTAASTRSATQPQQSITALPAEQAYSSEPVALGQTEEIPLIEAPYEQGLTLFGSDLEARLPDWQPALLESTGSWLRRGFWYSEVDVLLMDRVWRRDNFILGLQADSGGTGEFGAENKLVVEGGRTGAEATPRLNVGRFLFRDYKNRDHAMEFVAFGGGQWTQTGRLDATSGGTLNVGAYNIVESEIGFNTVRFPLDQGNDSFDGATAMQYDYNSRFNDFELNYHVKSRMEKDRMELEPSGHWVRRAQPSVTRSMIAGIRYFEMDEDFNWDAFGIDRGNASLDSGNYRVKTDNNLIGTQIGFNWTYETSRWSLGMANKSGMYWSHTNVDSSFNITGAGGIAGDNDSSVDNLAFISEGSLLAKWHLLPNFSLRAGLELLYVSSIAHASEQLNFIPVSSGSSAIVEGDSTFMGGTIGFERYW